MTEIVTTERTWTCACTSEHRPTISRAWCFDCTEWCYPQALCVRGEAEQLRAALRSIAGWPVRRPGFSKENEEMYLVREVARTALGEDA